jgi:hypothetical protein
VSAADLKGLEKTAAVCDDASPKCDDSDDITTDHKV